MTATDTAVIADRFIDVPKLRVHYPEAGAGHPVVLPHGSGPGATADTNFSQNIGARRTQQSIDAISPC
ncbi:MAG: 2-hydroxy-6-oxonona-2,4-dienedioate hydrolase [Mycobacterium sp.]|nr:2-hydroxy-6-oxonona-2,4-dienedioate hydrolase [Mycobacterium sp.]